MIRNTKLSLFAGLMMAILIPMGAIGPAAAVTTFNDTADINPNCANLPDPELYVSGTIDPVDDEIFFAWNADPSFYRDTGWFGTCNTLVHFDKLTVKVTKVGYWSEEYDLGTSAASSKTLEYSNDIQSGDCLIFGYTIKYSGDTFTVYPNNHMNCV